jgi:hypothetical protein
MTGKIATTPITEMRGNSPSRNPNTHSPSSGQQHPAEDKIKPLWILPGGMKGEQK